MAKNRVISGPRKRGTIDKRGNEVLAGSERTSQQGQERRPAAFNMFFGSEGGSTRQSMKKRQTRKQRMKAAMGDEDL